MRTSRFKPEDVLSLLSEAADGEPVREICIRHNISETTFYRWKAQYEGLGANGIRRVRELEQENSRLRRILDIKELEIDVLRSEQRRDA